MDIFTALLTSFPADTVPLTFKYTLKTDAYTSGNKVTSLPIPISFGAFPETITVDWGDGTTPQSYTATSGSAITHTYAVAGNYQVSIATVSGKIPKLNWYNSTNDSRYQLLSVDTPFPVMYTNVTTLATLEVGYESYIFAYCINLTSLPLKLFKFNKQITSLVECFSQDERLQALPTDLLSYLPLLTTVSRMCWNCNLIPEIPNNFFKNNTLINDFQSCFEGDTALTNIPEFLLKYQTGTTISYRYMFQNCPKLKLISNLFCDEATEKSTRFASATTLDFAGMFNRSTFTGIQGTAPDLWNYTLGGTVTKTYCFAGAGNSLTSLTNYADIPTAWKS